MPNRGLCFVTVVLTSA